LFSFEWFKFKKKTQKPIRNFAKADKTKNAAKKTIQTGKNNRLEKLT
jgi:hypothetical protein